MPYNSLAFHYTLPRSKEMGRVYWCNTLVALGSSLVSIFVPIYLIKIGYSFTDVLWYLLLQQLLGALLQFPASKLFNYFHPNHILAIGAIFYALFFALLGSWRLIHWSLFVLALFWGLNRATYWAAFHFNFSSIRAHQIATEQIAGFESLTILAAAIAPALGGLLASLININFSYVVAVFLLVLAALPLFNTAGEAPRTSLYISWHQFMGMRRDALANMCNGVILLAEMSLWPLLIFTIISSYAGIGALSAVIALSTVIVTLYVGKHHAAKKNRHFLSQGITTYSLTNFGRILVQNGFQVFGLNLLSGIGRSLYVTPFMNRYYTNSDGPERLGYITLMETAFGIGVIVFMLPLLIMSLILSEKAVLVIGLTIVGLCSYGVRLIR